MPEISVIMPVYNVEKYLRECLDSLLAQTFTDFEAICVNDGSTDGSPAILEEYAAKDNRIKIIDQPNSGAAKSRNNGMTIASGKYWMFLDSDDWFMPDMLQMLFNRAIETDAEITMCSYQKFHSESGKILSGNEYPSAWSAQHIFSLKSNGNTFPLENFPPAPWVYLYNVDYIKKLGLQFQDLPRTNDLFFTRCALLSADRITVIPRFLVNYRVGMTTNLQSGNSKTPLAFLQAAEAVADYLKKQDLFTFYKDRFAADLLNLCKYNLSTQRKGQSFATLYNEIRQRIYPVFLQNLDIANLSPQTTMFYQLLQQAETPLDYLILLPDNQAKELDRLYEEKEILETKLDFILNHSLSYKVGKLITWLPQKICAILKGSKNA